VAVAVVRQDAGPAAAVRDVEPAEPMSDAAALVRPASAQRDWPTARHSVDDA